MFGPFKSQSRERNERSRPGRTSSNGSSAPTQASVRAKIKSEWQLAEPMTADNALDSVGSLTLTQNGGPTCTGTGRTFDSTGAGQWFGSSNPGGDYTLNTLSAASFTSWFQLSTVASGAYPVGYRQVMSWRRSGTPSVELHTVIRAVNDGLQLVVGDGSGGSNFQVIQLVASGLLISTDYHIAVALQKVGSVLYGAYRFNNGTYTTFTPTFLPFGGSALVGGTINIGGSNNSDGENYDGTIKRCRFYSGSFLSAAEMAIDYADTRGV